MRESIFPGSSRCHSETWRSGIDFVLGLPTGRFGVLGSGTGLVLGLPTGRFGALGSGTGLVLGLPTGRFGALGSGIGLVLGLPTGRFPCFGALFIVSPSVFSGSDAISLNVCSSLEEPLPWESGVPDFDVFAPLPPFNPVLSCPDGLFFSAQASRPADIVRAFRESQKLLELYEPNTHHRLQEDFLAAQM